MSDATPSGGVRRPAIESTLSAADDRIVLADWVPPRHGIIPEIRFRKRWYSLLWAIPLLWGGIIVLVAVAQSLRALPAVQAFIQQYPGAAQSAPSVGTGFPIWLQVQHFLNMLFMMFIIRAGIQILADHPRLYWNRDCTPGTEWFRFQRPVPQDRIWTSKDDAVTLPRWLGIPGLRHTIGPARWWHFSIALLWTLNGIAFYVLLFTTEQWLRLIPSPGMCSRTRCRPRSSTRHSIPDQRELDPLQRAAAALYFITVFIAAPTSIATGLLQGPAISNKLGWLTRTLHRQAARSIHVLSFKLFPPLHPGTRDHGVHHRHPREHQPYVRRRREQLLAGLPVLRACDDRGRPGVVGRLALHDPPHATRAAASAASWSAGSRG